VSLRIWQETEELVCISDGDTPAVSTKDVETIAHRNSDYCVDSLSQNHLYLDEN
jgi:hypothetical protein